MNNSTLNTDWLFDQLLVAILVVNRDLTVAWCNSSSEELLRQSKRQLIGSHLSEVLIDSDFSVKAISGSLQSGNPYHQRNANITLINQEQIMADISVSSLEIDDERKLLVEIRQSDYDYKIGVDSSEYSQHIAASALVRGLGHEIKNPLGGLRGAAQLLAMELDDAELEEYTEVIIKEADRLSSLVDRMMAPNKVGKREFTNIHEVIERVLNLLTIESGDELNIIRDYDPSLPEIFASADQLQQAMLNIAQNAVQAMDGSGTLTIKTRVVRQMLLGEKIWRLVMRIDIMDDGPGIPKNLKDKLFMPLVSGRANGTGLGLGIAQSLIQQHDGLIEYLDKKQQTTFAIHLPITEQSNQFRGN